jgi:signal transduction histidine kinase
VRAVERLCRDFEEKTGIRTSFLQTGMDGVSLDAETEINLFRVVQEALGNVRRHAKAGQVSVKIVESHPRIILRVEDDGVGFDVGSGPGRHGGKAHGGGGRHALKGQAPGGEPAHPLRTGQGTRIIADIPSDRGGRHGG